MQAVLVPDSTSSIDDDDYIYDLQSVTSSVLDHEYENGRRYHGWMAGSYPLPNDEAEVERMDLKHHVMRLLCDGHLHIAPLPGPRRILDLGTGSGIWAIEMGEQYPDAIVHGVDLSVIQPELVPSNVHFEIMDVEADEWLWPKNHFDYIHSRFMISSISSWKRYINKAYQHIAPGGYLELQELDCRFRSDDGSLKDDSNLSSWSRYITEAAVKYNRPIPVYDQYVKWFQMAGFVDVKEILIKSPTNPWPKQAQLKEVGRFQLLSHLMGFEGVSLGLLCRGLSWSADEVNVLAAKMKTEARNRDIHSYQMNVIIVGRKPAPKSGLAGTT